MNNFQKDIKNFNSLFGQIEVLFLVIKFQLGGLTHDEGILWSKHPP
jgi:hypothetical protein